jgi:hypothetical protein
MNPMLQDNSEGSGEAYYHQFGMLPVKKRKPYNYIESETRRWLLHLVKDRHFKIKEAANALGINYSTAKTIL